jgi:hypothetical protein
MRGLLLIAGVMLALGSSAQAQQKAYAVSVGVGSIDCGTWLSTASYKTKGESWLLGYWSGINVTSRTNRMVGHTTDARGILGAVEKVCADDPTRKLSDATVIVYNHLVRTNR